MKELKCNVDLSGAFIFFEVLEKDEKKFSYDYER